MNHGNVGYLGSDYAIRLPRDVLRPLSASNGSALYGIHYSNPHKSSRGAIPVKYDFMLTPIQKFYWPRVAKYTLQVWHQPGALKAITKHIKRSGGTIVYTEASRSSHRYDTWNLTVGFPAVKPRKFNKKKGAYRETISAAKKLTKRIRKKCSKFLMDDPNDELRKNSINCQVNTALTYFHKLRKDQRLRTIEFVALGDGKIISPNDSFQKVVSDIAARYSERQILPAFVFAEMDTTDQNLRMVLLPEIHESKRFIGIQANWSTTGKPAQSLGLLNDMLKCFDPRWNVWRINSKTLRSQKKYESGRVNFLVEARSEFIDVDSVRSHLNRTFERINENPEREVSFDSLPLSKLIRRLNRTPLGSPWSELVISCSQANYSDGEKFGKFLRKNGFDANALWRIPGGRKGAQVIAERIRESKALFAVIDHRMNKGDASLGVRDEVMIALGAGVTVIPVAFGKHRKYDFSDLPSYFDSLQGIHIRSKDTPDDNLAKIARDIAEIQRSLRHSVSWMSD